MNKSFVISLSVIAAIIILSQWLSFRIDMTADKRYSISQPTRQLLRNLEDPIDITLYLDGELNPGFLRLQTAVVDLSEEFRLYAAEGLELEVVNPNSFTDNELKDFYQLMYKNGLSPTEVNERDRDGKLTKQTLYPFAKLHLADRSLFVPLLQNQRGKSGAENLNASIETLEYRFTDALRRLIPHQPVKIAFIEGHGELPEPYVYDAELAFSQYFQVDRGVIGNDASMLNDYKAIVIADPQTPFSEADKYIIDQYIMRGGRVMWLIDGVHISDDGLSKDGFTPAIPMDVNLTDMLFRYGVRINPVLVQDQQCLSVPVNISSNASTPDYQPMPFYYAPLLLTSFDSPVSKNVSQVMSSFVSTIDFVGEGTEQSREYLLATSNASRLISTPAKIDLTELDLENTLFQYAYMPVAVSIDGQFESVFAHRVKPDGVQDSGAKRQQGESRQIVIAGGSIIRNEVQKGEPLPMGYDRLSGMQFGNRDFIRNAMLWLTDDDGWIQLRNKEITLRLLNNNVARNSRHRIQAVTIISPLIFLTLIAFCSLLLRYYRYKRNEQKNESVSPEK